MSSTYAGGHRHEVPTDLLEEFCPDEYRAFTGLAEEKGIDMDAFSESEFFCSAADGRRLTVPERHAEHADRNVVSLEDYRDAVSAFDALAAAFSAATAVGDSRLALKIGNRAAEIDESGDYHDEKTYYFAEGVMVLTPAGERIIGRLESVNAVSFC